MNHPSVSLSRRTLVLLGVAAIALGGAITAFSTHPTASQPDTPHRPGTAGKGSAVAGEMPRGPDAFAELGTETLETLLDRIDLVERKERLRRWTAIFELAQADPDVAKKLKDIAAGRSPAASRYIRFVAAANAAGFGALRRMGPNNLRGGAPLGRYIKANGLLSNFQGGKQRLGLDPSLADLNVVVPPNADNTLHFQEILWTILEKYDLDFRTEPDGTFMIFPKKPPT